VTTTAIKQIKKLKPIEALDALNRLTNLTWREYPNSLLPGGIVVKDMNLRNKKCE